MSDEIHVFELLPAYALECLDEAEARAVAAHLAGCELCRMELRAFQDVTRHLALMVPEAQPAAELKSRLQERIQLLNSTRPQPANLESTSRPFLRRLTPVGTILGLVLIMVLLASNILLWQRLNHLEVLASPLGMRAIVLQNTDAAPQGSGFVIISSDGEHGVLVVDELPPLEPEHEYQLWLVRNAQSTSAAVFAVDESGYRGVRIEAPETLLNYSGVRVTIEPAGGSAKPDGQEVLAGSLFNP